MNHNDSGDCPYVFTSVRYDPMLTKSAENTAASCNTPCPVYLLEHHWTRMSVAQWTVLRDSKKDTAASNAVSSPSNLLRGIMNAVHSWHQTHPGEHPESLRIRIRTYVSGKITTEMWPLPAIPLTQLFPPNLSSPCELAGKTTMTVMLDIEQTEADESTMFKTSDRSNYGRARAGAGIFSVTAMEEVLLYNPRDMILDGSQATPYFYREGKWVTPSSESGGQQGTTRKWALKKGLAVEAEVPITSLTNGELIWLSNATHGFRLAEFRQRQGVTPAPDENDCRRISRQLM